VEPPVEVIYHTLPKEEQSCSQCGNPLHVIGENVRETFKLIPAKAVIERHIQYVQGCRDSEKSSCSVPIVKEQADTLVIKDSIASAEAVAYLMTQKFVISVPLHRQEQDWKRNSIPRSQQTMASWMVRCRKDAFEKCIFIRTDKNEPPLAEKGSAF
jgi:transposase